MPREDVTQAQPMPSDAKHVGYVPSTPSDWPTVPHSAQQALDTPSVAVVVGTAPVAILGRLWLDTSATGTGGTGLLARVTTTSDLTLTTSHTVVLCDASSGPLTVTLPAASANGGRLYHVKKADASANTVTVAGDGDDTIERAPTAVLTDQDECITIDADSVEDNWNIL